MKSKRMISLFMAALGSVSTSMAAKRVNKGGNVSSSNALRVRRPGGVAARGRKRIVKNSGQGARRPGGRIARKISETEKQKLDQSGAVLAKENAVEKKNAVNNGAHGGSQSTWKKMSDLEKGLTIGGSSLVGAGIVGGSIAAVIKREEINDWWIKRGNLSASEHNKKLCKKGASLDDNHMEGEESKQKKTALVKRWKTFKCNNGKESKEFVIVCQYGDNRSRRWYAVPVNYKKDNNLVTVENILGKHQSNTWYPNIEFRGSSLPVFYRKTLVEKLKDNDNPGQNAGNSEKRVRYQLGLEKQVVQIESYTDENENEIS